VQNLIPEETGAADGLFPAGLILRESPSSPDEMEEMAKFWNLKVTQLGRQRYHCDLVAFHTTRMQVSRVRHKNNSRLDGEIPPGTIILATPVTRGRVMQFHGAPIEARDLICQDCVNGLDISYAEEMEIISVAVSQELIRTRLSQLWQTDATRLLTRTLQFTSTERAAQVNQFLCEAIENATSAGSELSSPRRGQAMEEDLLNALLCNLEEPRPPEGAIARRWLARRAANVIHERCHEELSIGDLCEAVGSSRRTLHLGFLEVYGTSPMKYLLAVRLAGVRRELLHRKRRGVTDIATAWGFSHLGRFSASYRQYFGTLPSDDAHRR
jgi:AraC family ethanolamine operon transcriptional activator